MAGFGIAILRPKKIKQIDWLLKLYISYVRYTSIITQMFIVYFGLPVLLKVFGINAYKWEPEIFVYIAFNISPVIHFGKEKGYITEEIQFSHMVYQEHFKDIYTEEEIKKLLVRPQTDKLNEYRTWVIISVFLGTGIRSLELSSIRWM